MAKKIMVIDDSKTVRASVRYALARHGYEVIMAEDGQEGLDILKEQSREKPGMIITDVNMPRMDGITFIKEVKKEKQFKFIPILVLTTESQEEMKLKGKEAGAAGWLVKPFKPEQLISVARKFIK
ncbi:response regulator [Halothermothrix orenii]|uniref:Stage 0 sporulation protein A homolog n=1 Tax=Halothermothrix orenii (strain H 168 / OCM 544 / DSM 9562) TaxID=373903 RepID=B8D0S1_HALOH|nr:response regulator [Halothermothrix orenii]ACL71007.1 response regulator receiver protein [Halothermothrix orenii H 168]